MLMFLYNIRHDDQASRALHRHRRRAGARPRAWQRCFICLRCSNYDNYTVSIFYRWWTIHLWVEGVWEMIQGGLLAYLLIRLSGADREVMEKWLYVIVGLVFMAGILGTAHHYYWVGVPHYWLPIGGFFSALEPARAARHGDVRILRDAPLRPRPSQYAGPALDRRQRGVHGVRRRLARLRPYLAGRQQVDPWHPDHRDAWPRARSTAPTP